MARHWGGACSLAVALAGLAGCVMPDMLGRKPSQPEPEERVFLGSLEWVADTTEDVLRKLDVHFVTAPEGDGLRIRATTRKEGRFSMVLTRQAGQSEQTRMRLEWESGPKEPVPTLLFATLEALGPRR